MQDGTSYQANKLERTGWRDEAISRRHRAWGENCPCVDIDFLVVEYSEKKPVAVIEYKKHTAPALRLSQANYQALITLAGSLPFVVVRYWPEIWAFKALPGNDAAKRFFNRDEMLTEKQFVERLYAMRGMTVDRNVLPALNNILPMQKAA